MNKGVWTLEFHTPTEHTHLSLSHLPLPHVSLPPSPQQPTLPASSLPAAPPSLSFSLPLTLALSSQNHKICNPLHSKPPLPRRHHHRRAATAATTTPYCPASVWFSPNPFGTKHCLVDRAQNFSKPNQQSSFQARVVSKTGSPVTRWASVAFGAGVGIGSAYSECSHKFGGSYPKFTPKIQLIRKEKEKKMKQRKNPKIASHSDDVSYRKFNSENPIPKDPSPSLNKVFLLCLVTRIINSLLVQTYFNPDEHWQALEVAHRITFGYGHLTWEWKKGIRSYLHPVLFAALYKVLAFLRLDTPWFMIRAPRLLQSIFAAIGDLYGYKLPRVLFGDNVAKWALFAQLTNWFMFFCITRTLSNSLETVLTLVSLYYWPCLRASSTSVPSGSRKYALAIAALACAIRPTSAITWIYIGCLELLTAHDKVKFALLEVFPIGGLVLGLTVLLDRQFYGSWVIVPLNFVKFNFFSSGGDYYGTHPWHWYMTQGFTVMLFTYIPFSIAGVIKSKEWKLPGLILWVLGIYSLLGHKEFRFVLPVLPVALMFSGYSLADLEHSVLSQRKVREKSGSHNKHFPKLQMAVLFLLVSNVLMALYMSMVHQRGTEDVMNYLSKEAKENKVKSVLFLTPCHATPYYSTLHRNLPMRFMDCTPSEEKGTPDESDRFFNDPVGFAMKLARNWSVPSHIVLFDSQEKQLKEFLASHHFHEIRRFFHAHFKVDRELQASVVVYAFHGQ